MSPSVAMRFRHWLVVALGVSLVSLFPRIVVAQFTPGATPAGIMIAKGQLHGDFPISPVESALTSETSWKNGVSPTM
jgi:hypothetical protein